MRNLRHLLHRSGLLSNDQRRRQKSRRRDVMQRPLRNETLEKRELLAGDVLAPQHNYWNGYDVNNDGQITALDALAVINKMSQIGEGEDTSPVDGPTMFYDVNADHGVTASDALSVINAMSRGEGVGELIELQLTARDLDDQPLAVDGSGAINVDVGQFFDLEVSYNDLRSRQDRLGIFQLYTDLGVSQGGYLSPVLNETQQLIFDSSIFDVGIDSLTFSIEGSSTTYVSDYATYDLNVTGEISNMLNAFGYSSSQFTVKTLAFNNGDDGVQIHFVGDEFANINLPNITVEVNETDPADDVDSRTREIAPFLADGVTPNPEAIKFNINVLSRTFKSNEAFYTEQRRGDFDLDTGFIGVGGLGGVPAGGNGIPELSNNNFILPFDAYSLRVFVNKPVTGLVVDVNPGEATEATLLYGSDTPVPQDMVLVDEDARVTINAVGDQPGVFTVSPATMSASENPGTATFTITRSGGSDGAVSVNYTTADGTATAGSDYIAASGTLDFAAGETSKTVTVSIMDDTDVDPDETFTLTLSSPTGGATLGATVTSTVTITDNDAVTPVPGVFTVSPKTMSAGENPGTATFTITRSGGSDGAVSVNYTTANGTATAGSDYIAASGTLDFADGETSKTVTVSIMDDTDVDPDETFTLTLSSPTGGATLGSTVTSTVTITDNDAVTPVPGVFTVSPKTMSAGENAGTATFTITRSGGSDGAVSVNYTTANGTATAGSDYIAASGTLDFADGETSKTITVSIMDDTDVDPDETFTLTLSSPTGGATLGSTVTSTVTITDNDAVTPVPGVFTVSPATMTASENPGTATFTITRSGGSDGAVSVNYTTIDGTATAGSDYIAISGTLDFADGETSQTMTVSIMDDDIYDPDETFTFVLSSPTGGASLGAAVMSTVTITDNESAPVPGVLTVSPATMTASENPGTATFTITRSGGSDGAVSVDYTTADGTATAGSDYNAISGTIEFADGETSKTMTVSVMDDTIYDPDETFMFILSNPTGGATLGSATVSTVTIEDDDPYDPSAGKTIFGAVFIDNVDSHGWANGVMDPGDQAVGGLLVHLVAETASGYETVAEVHTDVSGYYEFPGVAPGDYIVDFALPDTLLYLGDDFGPISVFASDEQYVPGPDMPLLGTDGSATNNLDILASSYLSYHTPVAHYSANGLEGGLVSFDYYGDQQFFIAGAGFEDISHAELVYNKEQHVAVLIIGGGDLSTPLATQIHDFVASPDGLGVQFFGGLNDFNFVNAHDFEFVGSEYGTVDQVFENYQDAIDRIISDMY